MKRVTLLYPAARRRIGKLSTHHLPGLATPHSGLPILATILTAKGYDVRVYDESVTPFDERMFDDADFVGISIQTAWAERGYALAERARARGILVAFGGAHATLAPDNAILHGDFVIRGEGERTLPELLGALSVDATTLNAILGLTYRDAGVVKHNPDRPMLTGDELDALPFPDMTRIAGLDRIARAPLNQFVYQTMVSRGCSMKCTFCSVAQTFRDFRHRSVANVLEELGSRFNPTTQFLFFQDDSIGCDPEWLKALLDGMRRAKLVPKLGWHSQMRVDVARDKDLVRLMRETNCYFATFGFESINPRSLKTMGKGQSPHDIRRTIETMRTNGIYVNGFFVVGTDDDDLATIDATLEFALDSGCVVAGFMPLTPFPGTPLHERLAHEERIFTDDWELYDVQHVVFFPKRMTPKALYTGLLGAYRKFYSAANLWRKAIDIARRTQHWFHLLIGPSWPIVKQIDLAVERLSNHDYLRMLTRLQGPGHPKVSLNHEPKGVHDFIAGRRLRSVYSRACGVRYGFDHHA
ncbi:MAG: B12-binding domain-containing radical SAM protein [Deltaproteobacteria bacterium]|nr:B12-binding domain-containing radical SAM protein [Deltaproteobacteria bacterium]